jgi:hypothetical protein
MVETLKYILRYFDIKWNTRYKFMDREEAYPSEEDYKYRWFNSALKKLI